MRERTEVEGGFTPPPTFFPFCYPRHGSRALFSTLRHHREKGQGVVGKNKINCSTYPIRWQSRCPGDADSLLSSMLPRENREMFFPSSPPPPPSFDVAPLFTLFLFPSTAPFARLSLALALRPPICFCSFLSLSLSLSTVRFHFYSSRCSSYYYPRSRASSSPFFLSIVRLPPCQGPLPVSCRNLPPSSTTSEKNGTEEETNHNTKPYATLCLTPPFLHPVHSPSIVSFFFLLLFSSSSSSSSSFLPVSFQFQASAR